MNVTVISNLPWTALLRASRSAPIIFSLIFRRKEILSGQFLTTIGFLLLFSSLIALPAFARTEVLPAGTADAVCVVSGDSSSGTGFVARYLDKPCVVTNQHVIVGQKSLTIRNSAGITIKPNGGFLAGGTDVAILTLSETPADIVPFELSTRVDKDAAIGDEVVIVGNTLGQGTLTTTKGKILSFGPGRIEHDAPTFTGNSGSPVFHPKSGKVLGVDTESIKNTASNFSDKSSSAKAGAALPKDGVRLFAHRFDTETKWTKLDWKELAETDRLLNETLDMGEDLAKLLVKGDWKDIGDDILRGYFLDAEKKWKDKQVSDMDKHNQAIKAFNSARGSIDQKIYLLSKRSMCYTHAQKFSGNLPNLEKVKEALDIVIQGKTAARDLYAGKYRMPERISVLIYPNGSMLVFRR